MRQSIRITLLISVLTLFVAAAEDGLVTGYTLYIGFPDKTIDPSGSVLIVPGTLLPDMQGSENLDKQLKQAYRLQGLERPRAAGSRPAQGPSRPGRPGRRWPSG